MTEGLMRLHEEGANTSLHHGANSTRVPNADIVLRRAGTRAPVASSQPRPCSQAQLWCIVCASRLNCDIREKVTSRRGLDGSPRVPSGVLISIGLRQRNRSRPMSPSLPPPPPSGWDQSGTQYPSAVQLQERWSGHIPPCSATEHCIF